MNLLEKAQDPEWRACWLSTYLRLLGIGAVALTIGTVLVGLIIGIYLLFGLFGVVAGIVALLSGIAAMPVERWDYKKRLYARPPRWVPFWREFQ
jgi:hypothetical protein